MKKLLFLLTTIAALTMVGSAAAGTGTLTATCTDCGLGGDPNVVINGTGYQSNAHNQLTVIVWDSPNPVNCTTPTKSGSFTCVTTIDGPGWYNVVAYENAKTIIASTQILIN
jgi:hypothetical protein